MVVTLLKAVATCASTPGLSLCDAREHHRSKSAFTSAHPSYSDPLLSSLRKREFSRLDATSSVYLDYTGAALYPASLVRDHARWLTSSVAGNPHSTSPASLLSSAAADDARAALLEFFDADPAVYDVVWTCNATAGFRIVGEAYDFAHKTMLIPRDAHNSLNSLARKAQQGGGKFEFIEFDSAGEAISAEAYRRALDSASSKPETGKGLVFLTGQSNITGTKLDLSLVRYAKQRGWDVGLDAAALAPSTRISLRQCEVDFMAVSLYKIVGWPTGLGALILRKSQYANLTQKPTFFGGNIVGITMDTFDFTLVDGPERFEDGTANFAAMAAVRPGLEFAARWMPHYTARNRILMAWLIEQLETIHHPAAVDEKTDSPRSSSTFSLKHSSRRGGVRLVRVGGSKDLETRGSTLPLVFSSAEGDALNYRFVIWAAARQRISLRGGPCMCNPGASSAVMQRGTITDLAASTMLAEADVGIVRISFGAPTNFMDVWRLVRFCRLLTQPEWVSAQWRLYETQHPGSRLSNNIDHLHALATGKSL